MHVLCYVFQISKWIDGAGEFSYGLTVPLASAKKSKDPPLLVNMGVDLFLNKAVLERRVSPIFAISVLQPVGNG